MISISIELVLLILIAVIMFFSILTGLCQGFRKNMFKLVATIIFWIIFWVTAPLVKGKFFWYNEEFYQLLAPMLNGTQYANLMEFILANIANAIGMDPATLADPAIENTFIASYKEFEKYSLAIESHDSDIYTRTYDIILNGTKVNINVTGTKIAEDEIALYYFGTRTHFNFIVLEKNVKSAEYKIDIH